MFNKLIRTLLFGLALWVCLLFGTSGSLGMNSAIGGGRLEGQD